MIIDKIHTMDANNSSDFTNENDNQISIKTIDIQKKRTLLSKSSIGNKHLFNQQLPKKKSKSALHQFSSEITALEHFKDLTIVNQVLWNCYNILNIMYSAMHNSLN